MTSHSSASPRGLRRFPRRTDRPAAEGTATFRDVGPLARALVAYAPRKAVLALLLLLTAGVTEAFGIVMIVPLLHVVGLGDPSAEGSRPIGGPIVDTLAETAGAVGVALTLPTVLAVFLILAAVRAATAWQRGMLLTGMQLGFVDALRERLYAAVAGAKWEFLIGRRQSDLQHVLTMDVNRIGQGAFLLLQLTATGVLTLVQIGLAVLVSPLVTAAALLTGVMLLFLTSPMVRRSRRLGEHLTGANRTLFASMTDSLAGLKLVKSYAVEDRHVRHFADSVASMRERQMAFRRTNAAVQAALGVGTAAALAALVWFAVSIAALTPAELAIMTLLFARVMPAISSLQGKGQNLAHALPAYAHARDVLRALREAAEEQANDEAPRMTLDDRVTVHGVSFAYTAGTPVLANVDLDVPAGKITVVTGPSGAGKSTLADILLGLIEPDRGRVSIDGEPLAGPNLRRWRRSVAYVPQDPYLFHDTIRANLRWARLDATEAEMWQALRRAAAADFVAALPHGLDTIVGDRGTRVSGGERQRLALARALLTEPALLLLDEAIGQLDAATERRILAGLGALRGRMTVVAITHRSTLLDVADRVVRLESGRVAAAGMWCEPAPRLTPAPVSE